MKVKLATGQEATTVTDLVVGAEVPIAWVRVSSMGQGQFYTL